MTKEQSTIIKGIAILMMLWGHLFVDVDLVRSLHNILPEIQGQPFAIWIKSVMPPVPFFLILSGYGMYLVNNKTGGDKNRFSRLVHLYFVFWVVLLVFVPISHVIRPNEYPGSLIKLLGNMSGINPSYNTAMWFLLPYVLLALSAKKLIEVFSKINVFVAIATIYIVSIGVSWWISKHTAFLNSYRLIYIALEYIALMTPFMLGIYSAKFDVFTRLKEYCRHHRRAHIAAVMVLILVLITKCFIKISIFTTPFVVVFILLFSVIEIPNIIRVPLRFLGKYSMTMWMVHSYFYVVICSDFIYSFKTPLLIFVVLVIVSLLSSIVIQNVSDYIYNYIKVRCSNPRSNSAKI